MKSAVAVVGGPLISLLLLGPGFAQTTPQATETATPQATDSSPAPAAKPGMLSMPHRVTGEVVSSDRSNNVLTVKNAKGKDFTFAADRDTAPQLANLHQGDRVKVTYKKHHDQMVATKIIQVPAKTAR